MLNESATRAQNLEIQTKAKQIKDLLKQPTERNIKVAEKLNSECFELESKNGETRRLLEIKSANIARLSQYTSNSTPAFSPYRSLRYITGETRQEAELKAYRFGQWFLAAVFHPATNRFQKSVDWCVRNGVELKAARESINPLGGALVPQGVDAAIIELRERYGVFRSQARVTRMTDEVVTRPRRVGGLSIYWVDEGEAITDSQETWDNVQLVAKKLAAMLITSTELSDDAVISLADEVVFECAWAFSQREDECGFIGDGTSPYGGMSGTAFKLKNLDATIANIAGLAVATGTGYATSYDSIVLKDFSRVAGLLPAFADSPNTAWYMHRSFFFNVVQPLANAAGLNTDNESLAANEERAPRPLFLGYPVNFTQVLPKTSAVNQVCTLFGDLKRAAMFGDRRETRLRLDPYSLADTYQIRLQCTSRFHALTHDVGNASATPSLRVPGPIVGLITGAA